MALIGSSPQLEFIQPTSGRSIYQDWVDEHGYGLHHVGFYVPSVSETIRELKSILAMQTGRGYGLDGDGAYAYFDVSSALGTIFEAIERPKRRRPSEPF